MVTVVIMTEGCVPRVEILPAAPHPGLIISMPVGAFKVERVVWSVSAGVYVVDADPVPSQSQDLDALLRGSAPDKP